MLVIVVLAVYIFAEIVLALFYRNYIVKNEFDLLAMDAIGKPRSMGENAISIFGLWATNKS